MTSFHSGIQNIKVFLTRDHSYPNGTEGVLFIEGVTHQKIFTLEEPWKDNQKGISCIPKGKYKCIPHGWEKDTKFKQKQCWEITGVPGRTGILIHTGNTIYDIEGCCLVGLTRTHKNGTLYVLQSRDAMKILREIIGERSFELIVQGV